LATHMQAGASTLDERWGYSGAPRAPWTAAGGAWAVINGQVVQLAAGPGEDLLLARDPVLGDGPLSAELSLPAQGGDVGLIFRAQDAADYYFFSTANGGAIGLMRGGVARILPGYNAHRLAGLTPRGQATQENFLALAPATTSTVQVVLSGP